MDLIIMILWYLNLIVPNYTYTQSELDVIVQENQVTIQQIQSSPEQTQSVIEWWQTNPMIPTKR